MECNYIKMTINCFVTPSINVHTSYYYEANGINSGIFNALGKCVFRDSLFYILTVSSSPAEHSTKFIAQM